MTADKHPKEQPDEMVAIRNHRTLAHPGSTTVRSGAVEWKEHPGFVQRSWRGSILAGKKKLFFVHRITTLHYDIDHFARYHHDFFGLITV